MFCGACSVEQGQPMLSLSGNLATRHGGPPPAKQQRTEPPRGLQSQPHPQSSQPPQLPCDAPSSRHHSSAAVLGRHKQCAVMQSAASQPVVQRSSAPASFITGLHPSDGMPPIQSPQQVTSQQPALQRGTSLQAQHSSWQPLLPSQTLWQAEQQQQVAMPGTQCSLEGIDAMGRPQPAPSQTHPHSPSKAADPTGTSQPGQVAQVNMQQACPAIESATVGMLTGFCRTTFA
jgi:hypothetical protein